MEGRPRRDEKRPVLRLRKKANGALVAVALALAVVVNSASPSFAADQGLWQALKSGGHLALLRHAIAPGTGDPSNFVLGNCATQRNLSQDGRAQAERIGDRFRASGIAAAKVYSSQWCRCLETAELLRLGPVEELPALNSFFRRNELSDPRTRALKTWIEGTNLGEPTVLVTHQVNITALTGVFPASGELVVVRLGGNGALSVVGTIETDSERGQ